MVRQQNSLFYEHNQLLGDKTNNVESAGYVLYFLRVWWQSKVYYINSNLSFGSECANYKTPKC